MAQEMSFDISWAFFHLLCLLVVSLLSPQHLVTLLLFLHPVIPRHLAPIFIVSR